LSFSRAGRIAECMARAIGEWSWVFNKNLLQGDQQRQGTGTQMSYMWKEKKKVSKLVQRIRCAIGATGANYPNTEEINTYPRSSRKRQITFATISSFFSSGGRFVPPGLTLVRAACFSVAVAPKQSAKSIVEDCQGCYVSVGISGPIMILR
jgi:hypothetical protein